MRLTTAQGLSILSSTSTRTTKQSTSQRTTVRLAKDSILAQTTALSFDDLHDVSNRGGQLFQRQLCCVVAKARSLFASQSNVTRVVGGTTSAAFVDVASTGHIHDSKINDHIAGWH